MSLSGRHFLVAAETWDPWVILKEDRMEGFGFETFETISKLLNFTYSIVRPPDGTWGTVLPNGSVTGMIGMVHRKEVDMAMGPFVRSYERSTVVDFSSPVYIDFYGILMPRPKLAKDLSNFLNPFAFEVWIGLLLCLIFCVLFGVALEKLVRPIVLEEETHPSKTRTVSFFKPIWIIKALTTDVVEIQPSLDSARILWGMWLLVGLFLTTAYSGVLTAILAVPKVTIPVDSLQDLVSYGRIPWATEFGSSTYQLFRDSRNGTNKLNRIIGRKMLLVKDCYRGKRRIVDEGIAIICDFVTMRKIIDEEFSENGTCSYYIGKEPLYTVSLSFIFQQESPYQEPFNKWIRVLRESGLIDRKIIAGTSNVTTCLGTPGSERKNTIIVFTMEDLAGIFLLLCGGIVIAFILLILENLSSKIRTD